MSTCAVLISLSLSIKPIMRFSAFLSVYAFGVAILKDRKLTVFLLKRFLANEDI